MIRIYKWAIAKIKIQMKWRGFKMKALFFCIHCNCKAKEIKTTSAVVFLCVLLKGGKTGLAALQKYMYYSNYVEYFSCLHISWFAKGVQRLLKATPTTILLLHLSQTIRMQHFHCKKKKQKITTYQTIIVVCTIFVCRNCKITECNNCKKNKKINCHVFSECMNEKNVLISIPSFVRQMNDGIIDKNRQKQVRKCSEFQANECFANL